MIRTSAIPVLQNQLSSGSIHRVLSGKTRLRIAYLLSEYPALSHSFVLREVKRLRALDCEVLVVSINNPRQSAEAMANDDRDETRSTFYIKRSGVIAAVRTHLWTLCRQPVAYFRGLGLALSLGATDLRQLLYGIFYFTEALMLGGWMKREHLHHVHVHFANAAATVGLIASRAFGVGFSFTVHGPDEFYDVNGQRLVEKVEGASFVICISHFARSQLQKLVRVEEWPKLEIARLGVDPAVFAPRPFRASPQPFNLLCVGRLVPAKGQHVLLAAVDHLRKAGRNVALRVVGDGPDRPNLELEVARRGIGKFVTFVGGVNQDRIRWFYREADAFVLASFAEGIPVVLMEAMAMEIPCISTTIAGIPELIRSDIDGLLVPPSDEFALAEAISRLMDDRSLRCRLGKAGRLLILKEYDLDRNVERLSSLFRTRLEQSSGARDTAWVQPS